MNATGDRLDDVMRFVACPACRGPLERGPEFLRCLACPRAFPLVDGRPVFIPEPAGVKLVPAEHRSNPLPDWVAAWLDEFGGWALNVGAGGSAERRPRVVELEYALFRHTDLSADAHELPFRDASFDAVITFNTFEHLSDPPRAAREIRRVLKPGGRLILRTAFLQPVHEPPYHFYNATEYGVRKWFEGFDVRACRVSDNFHPGHVLAWLAHEMLAGVEHHLGTADRERLAESTVADWAAAWADPARRSGTAWEALGRLPQVVQAQFSAGFELDAVRPHDSAAAPDVPREGLVRRLARRWLARPARAV